MMFKALVRNVFSLHRNKKWVKIKPKELIEKYPDFLRELWHNGSVEHLLNRFYLNVYTGKIKIKKE